MAGSIGSLAISAGMAINYVNYRRFYNSSLKMGFSNIQHYHSVMISDGKIRDKMLYIGLGIYAINIIDAFLSIPKSGYRLRMNIRVMTVHNMTSMNMGIKLTF